MNPSCVAIGIATQKFPIKGSLPGWEENSYGIYGFHSACGPTWGAGQTAGMRTL